MRYMFREKYKKIEQYLSQEEVQTPFVLYISHPTCLTDKLIWIL